MRASADKVSKHGTTDHTPATEKRLHCALRRILQTGELRLNDPFSEQEALMIDVAKADGPAQWASYFINGDDSSLDAIEVEKADAFRREFGEWRFVSTDGDEFIGRHKGMLMTMVTYVLHAEITPADEVSFVCDMVNSCNEGGPVASPATLKYVPNAHIINCLKQAIEAGLSKTWQAIAEKKITEYGAVA